MSSGPMHDLQAELRAERDAARARVAELEAEDRTARRSLSAARAPLLDYQRECEAQGVDPDLAEVERLEAPVREAASRVAIEPVHAAGPGEVARLIGHDVYDSGVRARLEGARERLATAEDTLGAFEQEAVFRLLEESAPDANTAAEEWVRAARELRDATRSLSSLASVVIGLGKRTGAFEIGDVPAGPLPIDAQVALDAGIARGVEGLIPLPLFLLEVEEEEAAS